MAELHILPDVVGVTRDWLVSVPEVVALVGTRVSTSLPSSLAALCVTIQRIGGTPTIWQHLDRAAIDVNVWDGRAPGARDHEELWLAARTVRAALMAMPAARLGAAVVTAVEDLTGMQWLPDTIPTPPVDRVHFSVAVTAH